VLGAVRAALLDAGVEAPVLVGHSGGAGIAVTYGAAFPSRGVITVDGSLMVGEFARTLHAMRPALEGQDFDQAWAAISGNVFGLDELNPDVRSFVAETSRARQAVLLGYWQDLLDGAPPEIQSMIFDTVTAIRRAGLPFVAVAGRELSPAESTWLATNFPEARTLVWARSGHFPHLAHPREFAELLAETATWTPL
ncbi:MAG TPA: alpha/beta hydrolase, partial [Candidatus Limnocylindria bacterium]